MALFNVWTRSTNTPSNYWHVLPSHDQLPRDKAIDIALSGNRNSIEKETHLQYSYLPVSERPDGLSVDPKEEAWRR